MKILSVLLLLAASMAFFLLGCSESSGPAAASTDQTVSGIASTPALAKGGRVIHSASGNCGIFLDGKNVTFAFTALKYADGSCSGEYQIYVHSQEPDWGRWHGKVMSLEVFDGNKAVIGGIETHSGFPGYYDAFVVIDNGDGKTSTGDMYTTTVFWNESLTHAQQVWAMPPDLVVQEIINNVVAMGLPAPTPEQILIPIQNGNIQVR